ncbi:helix-turn-helix domain-containing protein [Montanilutibacter psychrotolerans]|uniref:AraC family transcriptional regulator n=1 Tax=Montanilutibacter psychrotolerans TaxID=1327343 RepID=A0A3M8SL28_9GAMM|nr:AraC family transcriptional regulator [Lysobacter psychrotolerans]RNF81909.1 AraC family transcriptional regulator [Lysobacter psychrotolerans]
MQNTFWADRGQLLQLDATDGESQTSCVAVSRLASAQLNGTRFSIWLQLRGSSWIEAKEGRFRMRRGDWIALDRDSRPHLQADRDGLAIGLTLDVSALRALSRFADCGLYAGRGSMSRHDARIALRLWREATTRQTGVNGGIEDQALRPLLLHLAAVQREISARIPRCPGRSRTRKRQVFGRLQRARLYLEGNCDRVVRISELAELTSFSSWYFSKTFHSLYEESPQAAAARMRLDHAAELLRSTSMMIGEVAAASGFDNCCSFARAFRARHGMSASNFRAALSAPKRSTGLPPHAAKPAAGGRKAVLRSGT